MTQEDKKLLLKDLCARLPYGVMCARLSYNGNGGVYGSTLKLIGIHQSRRYMLEFDNGEYMLDDVKPYLRSMDDMTEEEFNEFEELEWSGNFEHLSLPLLDWLNKKMFDYRGLIEKGLALEAPKDMYNFKELI